jgi:hypothetical protein
MQRQGTCVSDRPAEESPTSHSAQAHKATYSRLSGQNSILEGMGLDCSFGHQIVAGSEAISTGIKLLER